MPFISRLFNILIGTFRSINRRSHKRLISGSEVGERIKIYDLICPLRYDILVRAEFIRFLVENDYLSEGDLDTILKAPETQRYQTWFREIPYRRRNPEHSHNEHHFQELFHQRICKVQQLWNSMNAKGFDYSQPVRLRGGELVFEVNGKSFDTLFYAGDGCHRIACLWIMGKDFLEPEEYEVAMRKEFTPLDNTAVLLDKLSIPEADYLSFISRGYCDGQEINSADEALTYVEKHHPERLDELKNVFQHDLSHL